LGISARSDLQVTAFLPSGYSGLVQLTVTNADGQHTVNIMTAAAPPPPLISLPTTQACGFALLLLLPLANPLAPPWVGVGAGRHSKRPSWNRSDEGLHSVM
jgi:hypothetical protein